MSTVKANRRARIKKRIRFVTRQFKKLNDCKR